MGMENLVDSTTCKFVFFILSTSSRRWDVAHDTQTLQHLLIITKIEINLMTMTVRIFNFLIAKVLKTYLKHFNLTSCSVIVCQTIQLS